MWYNSSVAPHWATEVLAGRNHIGAQPTRDIGIFLCPHNAHSSMADCAGDTRKGVPVPLCRSANPRIAPSPNLLAGI